MYKVFINNKPLYLSDVSIEGCRNIPYSRGYRFSEALHVCANSDEPINLYSNNLDRLWRKFQEAFKVVLAAGGLVLNKNKELLLIYRFGKWDLPKGKMETGESTEETAIREIQEECSIQELEIINSLGKTHHIYMDDDFVLKTTYWYVMNYLGNDIPQPQAEEGIEKIEWIKPEINHPYFKNTYGNIQDLIAKAVNEDCFT